jgi:hypothetical protein
LYNLNKNKTLPFFYKYGYTIVICFLLIILTIVFNENLNPDWEIYKNIYYLNTDGNVNKGDILFVSINKLFRNLGFSYQAFRIILTTFFCIVIVYTFNFSTFKTVSHSGKILFFLCFFCIRFTIQIREGLAFAAFLLFILLSINDANTNKSKALKLLPILIISSLIHTGLFIFIFIFISSLLIEHFGLTKKMFEFKTWIVLITAASFLIVIATPLLNGKIYLLKTTWQQQPIRFTFEKLLFWISNSTVLLLLGLEFKKLFPNPSEKGLAFFYVLTHFLIPIVLLWLIYLLTFSGSQSLISALYRLCFFFIASLVFLILLKHKKLSPVLYLSLFYSLAISIRTVTISLQQ